MFITPRWYVAWDQYIQGTRVNRVDVLDLAAKTYKTCKYLTSRHPSKAGMIRALGDEGVFNYSQIGQITCTTKQTVANILNEAELKPTHTVRSKLNPEMLPEIREVCTRLVGRDGVPDHMLVAIQNGTDKALLEHLTGIPDHVLRKAKKLYETELADRLSDHGIVY